MTSRDNWYSWRRGSSANGRGRRPGSGHPTHHCSRGNTHYYYQASDSMDQRHLAVQLVQSMLGEHKSYELIHVRSNLVKGQKTSSANRKRAHDELCKLSCAYVSSNEILLVLTAPDTMSLYLLLLYIVLSPGRGCGVPTSRGRRTVSMESVTVTHSHIHTLRTSQLSLLPEHTYAFRSHSICRHIFIGFPCHCDI